MASGCTVVIQQTSTSSLNSVIVAEEQSHSIPDFGDFKSGVNQSYSIPNNFHKPSSNALYHQDCAMNGDLKESTENGIL